MRALARCSVTNHEGMPSLLLLLSVVPQSRESRRQGRLPFWITTAHLDFSSDFAARWDTSFVKPPGRPMRIPQSHHA